MDFQGIQTTLEIGTVHNDPAIETTGAQHTETNYGATSATRGQETFTKGQEEVTKGAQTNTEGEVTNTHNVAPNNVVTGVMGSSDVKSSQTFTDGQRVDTDGQRIDTTSARTDTSELREVNKLTAENHISTNTL